MTGGSAAWNSASTVILGRSLASERLSSVRAIPRWAISWNTRFPSGSRARESGQMGG